MIAPNPIPDAGAAAEPPLVVARVLPRTEAEGPGARFAVWVQGCPLRCPGCCNPEFLADPTPGEAREGAVEALIERMQQAREGLEGISLLGGEPFRYPRQLARVARRAQELGLTVMIYTGFELEALRSGRVVDGAEALLAEADLVVDGPYDRERPEHRRRWIGSRNQLLHRLTDRYAPDDPRFLEPNTAEVHFIDGELTINGWPALADKLSAGLPRMRRRAPQEAR